MFFLIHCNRNNININSKLEIRKEFEKLSRYSLIIIKVVDDLIIPSNYC